MEEISLFLRLRLFFRFPGSPFFLPVLDPLSRRKISFSFFKPQGVGWVQAYSRHIPPRIYTVSIGYRRRKNIILQQIYRKSYIESRAFITGLQGYKNLSGNYTIESFLWSAKFSSVLLSLHVP